MVIEDIIIYRLRIGHSNLHKSLQMIGEMILVSAIHVDLTVEHVIINCLAYESERIQFGKQFDFCWHRTFNFAEYT